MYVCMYLCVCVRARARVRACACSVQADTISYPEKKGAGVRNLECYVPRDFMTCIGNLVLRY
jgi:hypothetical protein